ncbi:hypothetical protein Hanom_Chr17g01585311 [Helianthus anomalus]
MPPRRRAQGKGPMMGRGPRRPQQSHLHHSSESFHASKYINSPHPSQIPQGDDPYREMANSGTE